MQRPPLTRGPFVRPPGTTSKTTPNSVSAVRGETKFRNLYLPFPDYNIYVYTDKMHGGNFGPKLYIIHSKGHKSRK